MSAASYKRYTVTAALLYANGPIHIGHLAGCYLPADAYVRFLRAQQKDVIFVTGSDEHGVPITIKAQKEGLSPQQVVDKYHKIIKDTFEAFGVSPDIYSRTSNPVHHQTAQDFFTQLYNQQGFVEETSEQFYDVKAEKFLADRYIIGTCPNCGNDKAYGDQCEKCGTTLSPDELIHPHSALSGEQPIKKETKNWYLPLDQIQESFLNQYIAEHSHWKPNVYGQCKSWLKEGLKPRAMTRDLDWGVPVPLPNAEGKVLYVWFDAPIGYISMTKELFGKALEEDYRHQHQIGLRNPSDPRLKNHTWETYWKEDEETCLVHFIGKDNIVFHCLIFPAMTHAHGGLKLADEVPANEFLNLEGDKISTSRNWAVWAHEFLIDFPGKQDVLRYFLLANAPESKDNNFTWKEFQMANNGELVAILGNFINRTLVLTQKYFEGKVPSASEPSIASTLETLQVRCEEAMFQFKFRDALTAVMEMARFGNKYLADTEPWKLAKTDMQRVEGILFNALQISARLAICLEPFMPTTAATLANMLNLKTLDWKFQDILLATGHVLGTPALLFDKIEDDAIAAQMAKLVKPIETHMQENASILTTPTLKPMIQYDDFSKLDLRVATIIAAEKVEKADKLLKLTLDLGTEQRTVVSGIALHHQPESVIGQQVTLLANLAPRKLKGIESQGMILMAEDANGLLQFVSPAVLTSNGASIQ